MVEFGCFLRFWAAVWLCLRALVFSGWLAIAVFMVGVGSSCDLWWCVPHGCGLVSACYDLVVFVFCVLRFWGLGLGLEVCLADLCS